MALVLARGKCGFELRVTVDVSENIKAHGSKPRPGTGRPIDGISYFKKIHPGNT
jgi:hypothetical protein